MLQAVTPQLLAAHAKAGGPAVRQALLQCLRRLEGAAPAAALYPVLVEMRRDRDGAQRFHAARSTGYRLSCQLPQDVQSIKPRLCTI